METISLEEAREAELDRLYSIIEAQVEKCKRKDGMLALLQLLVRFPELSLENILLLHKFKPRARQLGLREDWIAEGNPVRAGAHSIHLVSFHGDIQHWYDLSLTSDVPDDGSINLSLYQRPDGILSSNPLRETSLYAELLSKEPFYTLNHDDEDNEATREAIIELARLIMTGAPFRFEIVSSTPWDCMCTVSHPTHWHPASNTFRIMKGLKKVHLFTDVAAIRGLLMAQKENVSDEIAWVESLLASYVLSHQCGIDMLPPEGLDMMPGAITRMDSEAMFRFLKSIKDIADALFRIMYRNWKEANNETKT